MIDLGRWLDEDIGVPHEGGPEAERVDFRRGETEDEETEDEETENSDSPFESP
jgi:endogenous inhibitor of DNA gyrase (YacG/DUF329 family)